jgi:hypothetical protein
MGEHVWVSNMLNDEASLGVFARTNMTKEQAIAAVQRNTDGQPVSQDLCPTRIWSESGVEDHEIAFEARNPDPDLFFASSYWIISGRAAGVLRQFDLGEGALYPVSEGVFNRDDRTRLPKEYFCWIFGNKKSAFLSQESRNVRAPKIEGLWWNMPWTPADDDVAVSGEALQGPDVWLDKMLFKSVFLSGPLGDALDAAGLREVFHLFKCRVI